MPPLTIFKFALGSLVLIAIFFGMYELLTSAFESVSLTMNPTQQ